MRKSFKKRIRITKTGKVLRRKMGVGHFRAKKSSSEKHTKRKTHILGYSLKGLRKRIID